MISGMYTQMMDIREELREGSRDRRIPDDPVTVVLLFCLCACLWLGVQ